MFKVVFAGARQAGKTSLMRSLLNAVAAAAPTPTVGVDVETRLGRRLTGVVIGLWQPI